MYRVDRLFKIKFSTFKFEYIYIYFWQRRDKQRAPFRFFPLLLLNRREFVTVGAQQPTSGWPHALCSHVWPCRDRKRSLRPGVDISTSCSTPRKSRSASRSATCPPPLPPPTHTHTHPTPLPAPHHLRFLSHRGPIRFISSALEPFSAAEGDVLHLQGRLAQTVVTGSERGHRAVALFAVWTRRDSERKLGCCQSVANKGSYSSESFYKPHLFNGPCVLRCADRPAAHAFLRKRDRVKIVCIEIMQKCNFIYDMFQ